MKSVGQLLLGVFTAVGTGLLVLAAISLALVEGGAARESIPPGSSATAMVVILTPAGGVTVQPTAALAISATPAPSNCKAPDGWVKYVVQTGDDMSSLAAQAGITTDEFMRANCMVTKDLLPGFTVSVPFIATETATETVVKASPTRQSCSRPAGWAVYTVQRGDTLLKLSRTLGITVGQLQQVNCLKSTLIVTGMELFVPFIPASQSTATSTPTPYPSATPENQFTATPTLAEKPARTETSTPETNTTAETPTAKPATGTPPAESTPSEATPAGTIQPTSSS